jgi:hypothetical protein
MKSATSIAHVRGARSEIRHSLFIRPKERCWANRALVTRLIDASMR